MQEEQFTICEDTVFHYCRIHKWGGGWTPRNVKDFGSLEQGFQIPSKTIKNGITCQIPILNMNLTQENAEHGEAQALEAVMEPRNAKKIFKNAGSSPLGP